VDNVPGATRAGHWRGSAFNETLTMYSKHMDAYIFSFHGQGLTLAPPNEPAVTWESYVDTISFQSICSGKATHIDILTYICSDNPIPTYDFSYTLHMSTFEGMAAGLAAPVLAGDCPCVSFFLCVV
jgi:hypothetical protein